MLFQLGRDGMHYGYSPLVDLFVRKKEICAMNKPYQGKGTLNTIWYLEQTCRIQPRPVKTLDIPVKIVHAELPSPELSRFLYTAVGGDLFWVDRLPWTWHQWYDWLTQPGVETWVAWVRGTPAGYAELHAQSAGQVELTYFGLLPFFTGQGLGSHLLTVALDRAWTIAHRWSDQQPTTRVWLHTCSQDSPIALPIYQSHGLRIYRTQIQTVHLPTEPAGPWPGACRQ
jgi:GNAT superfamily N-acetyltransferase